MPNTSPRDAKTAGARSASTGIHLYQLHAPDPRTPLSTSVRALAALKRDGLIDAIGLSNVTVGQIEEARRITEIDSIQVELSVWHDEHFLSGVAEYCLAHRLRLLAYRPLGGPVTPAPNHDRPDAHRGRRTPWGHAVRDRARVARWISPTSSSPYPARRRSRRRSPSPARRSIALTDEDRVQLDRRFAGRAFVATTAGPRSAHAASIRRRSGARHGSARCRQEHVCRRLDRAGLPPPESRRRRAAGCTICCRRWMPRLPRARHASFSTTPTCRASRGPRWFAPPRHADSRFAASGSRRASKRRRPTPPGASCRVTARCPAVPSSSGFASATSRRFSRPCSSGISGSSNRRTRRRDSRASTSCRSRGGRDPSFVNRAVIVWCDGVLLRSRSGRRSPASPEDVDVPADRAAVLASTSRRGLASARHVVAARDRRGHAVP